MVKPMTGVGLDIGQTTTKLVMLRRSGNQIKVVKAALLSNREEGIVSQEELSEHLGVWLKENGAANRELAVGVPQYLAIVQLSDFPPASKAQLDDMVAMETQQLAGLSDEAFLHDHRTLAPFETYRNPVLIGVCRESAVWERLGPLLDSGQRLVDVAMDGYALATAYERLVLIREADAKAHLVVDIGLENSTLAVMVNGQPVHVGSFTAGGHIFTSALMRHLGVSETDAERTKLTSHVNPAHADSPLTAAARAFATELHAAVEHWQYQGGGGDEDEAAAPKAIGTIYLSGGGARLPGLAEFLGNVFDCPVKFLRPGCSRNESEDLQYAVAYGVALQSLEPPARRISLAPPRIEWQAQRRRRVPALVMATALLTVLLTLSLAAGFVRAYQARDRLARDQQQLDKVSKQIPTLKSLKTSVELSEKMLLPFAARGDRNRTLVKALEQLGEYLGPSRQWAFYLADEETYNRSLEEASDRGRDSRPAAPSPFGASPAESRSGVLLSTSVKPWRRLIYAGFTKDASDLQRLDETLIAMLKNENSIFAKFDTTRIAGSAVPLSIDWKRYVPDERSFAVAFTLRDDVIPNSGD